MKKLIALILALICVLYCPLTFSSCGIGGLKRTYEVNLVYNNGSDDEKIVVNKGNTFPTPSDPEKENYIFEGWYTDETFEQKYDFSRAVTDDLTLYAKYKLDAAAVTNKISQDTIRGVVKVYNKSYNSFLGIEIGSTTSQGSGFCFRIEDGCYYILTNCHVAVQNPSYDNQELWVEDYQGHAYRAYLYKNPDKSESAISPSYDLACLYFKTSSTNVKELSIVSTNPENNDDIISIGSPNQQSNSITYGTVSNYKKITLSDEEAYSSNVTFEVIHHTAFIDNGSSGGPLLNANLDVVGVNYAATDDTVDSYAIPAEKVIEFLNSYVYD